MEKVTTEKIINVDNIKFKDLLLVYREEKLIGTINFDTGRNKYEFNIGNRLTSSLYSYINLSDIVSKLINDGYTVMKQ